MGLFSNRTKVYVASTAYNLAGDQDLRPNVIRSVVLGTVLSGTKRSIGDGLIGAMNSGPAAKQRRFFDWAEANYSYGMPQVKLSVDQPVSSSIAQYGLTALLSLGSGQSVRVASAIIDFADIHYWAEWWIAQNYSELSDDDWGAEWIETSNEIAIFVSDVEVIRLAAPDDLIWGVDNTGSKLLYISYWIETQDALTQTVTRGLVQLHTYRMGSGNVTFDALALESFRPAEFYPAMPLRLNKQSIREPAYDSVFENLKTGYKKLTGANINKLLDSIEENSNLGDVYCAFLVQGVSLNTKEKTGREYIYKFLASLQELQNPHGTDLNLMPSEAELAEIARRAIYDKAHAQGIRTSPIYNQTKPDTGAVVTQTTKAFDLVLQTPGLSQAHFLLQWLSIKETEHVGNCMTYDGNLSRGMAKIGDYWFTVGPPVTIPGVMNTTKENPGISLKITNHGQAFLFHQYSKRRYRKLSCIGLVHKNYVYGGHADVNSSTMALTSVEESPFLIPLHSPTLRKLGSLKATQLGTCSSYIVFNSYQIQTIKWYQTGFFKAILVVAGIALSIFTAGASLGAAAGILGTNLAVGTAIGASVASAAIIGAIANSVAAMVVSALVSKASVALFGEKIGTIVATIASFAVMAYGNQFATTGTFDVDWTQLLRADRIMDLTSAVSKAYTGWLNADIGEIRQELAEMSTEQQAKLDEIKKMSGDILGMTSGEINPMMFTESQEHLGESSETFLNRTLLTGSDLAELTRAMVENFAEISLELPKSTLSHYV